MLRELDTVAYIRFASVYRQFEDIEAFADAIQEIGGRQEAAGQAQAADPVLADDGTSRNDASGLSEAPVRKKR